MAVTIKDIARIADVSHTTVSRALRNHPGIAQETVARIERIAEELGYVPNTAARGLKTSRSGILGVIVRRIADPFFSEVLHGIEDVLVTRSYSLFLAASNRDPNREQSIVQAMAERRVDGVIICSTQVSEEHQQQLSRFGVPTVLINNQASEDISYSVYHDDVHGAHQLGRHLIDLGHTRIAYLANINGGRTSDERLQGLRAAMAESGLTLPSEYLVHVHHGSPESGAEGAAKLLQLDCCPTAIVCYNDLVAIGAMQALQHAGLRVPQDCSITGYDNIELSAYVTPPLTTFDQPKYDLGSQAAKMMLRLLSNPEPGARQDEILTLRGRLEVRNSTAPPRRQPAGSGPAPAKVE